MLLANSATETTRSTSPLGASSGMTTITWYAPGNSEDKPAKYGSTLTFANALPIPTPGVGVTLAKGSAAGPARPVVTAGEVAPKPIAQTIIAWPGRTGFAAVFTVKS